MFIALTTAFMTACEKDDSDFSNYKLETDDPDPEPEPEPDDTTTVVTNDTIHFGDKEHLYFVHSDEIIMQMNKNSTIHEMIK